MTRPHSWSLSCCLFALLGLASCASNEWDARVGTYTYEDAVSAYGKPDRCERTPEGNKTCSWRITTGKTRIDKDKILLVFDSEGKLKSGKTLMRDVGK